MLTATVIGSVWATRRLAELPNGAFLKVEAEGAGQRLVAFDVLGRGVGERVPVTQGSVAAAWFAGQSPPVDALIIGSIDPDRENPRTRESPGSSADSGDPRAAELRVYLMLHDLQPQFAAYLGTPVRARGYPPFAGQRALIVEVAPALVIERVTDLALRAVPAVEPGILFVERQFGVLEV
ncbi:MAG: EutN/CcmL family microcompartment protein, partial [Streptosporangiaceae bacterium]